MRTLLSTIKIAAITTALSVSFTAISYAGQWKQDTTGSWWQEDNGSYPVNTWSWIDGNQDGVSECYYFDGNGYRLTNTVTPDGYQVNGDGAWVADGKVQTRSAMQVAIQKSLDYYHALYPDADGTFVIFEEETIVENGCYVFTVRWQMSDEEAERRMKEGGTVAANIWSGMVHYNIQTGEMWVED